MYNLLKLVGYVIILYSLFNFQSKLSVIVIMYIVWSLLLSVVNQYVICGVNAVNCYVIL